MSATDPATTDTTAGVLDTLKPGRKLAPVDTEQPILPAWMRDAGAFRSAAARNWRLASYRARKLAVVGPQVVLLLICRSPVGFARLVALVTRWAYDNDTASLRHGHASRGESMEAAKVQGMRRANLAARFLVASVVAGPPLFLIGAWVYPHSTAIVLGAAAALWIIKIIPGKHWGEYVAAAGIGVAIAVILPRYLVLIPKPPEWSVWTVVTGVVLGLGWYGRNREKGLVKAGALRGPAELAKPTADMIVDALCRIGVKDMTPNKLEDVRNEVRWIAPGIGRGRRGWHIELELPWAVTATEVMEKREPLAGVLKREMTTVWPSRGPRHPGHLRIFLSDLPMVKAPQDPWPLAKGKAIDIFESFPFATDEQGEWVDIKIAGTHVAIGGASGFGKSVGLRQIAAAAALDPRVRLIVFDGKRSGDFEPVRKLAHGFYVGAEPEDVAEQLAALKAIEQEVVKRGKLLEELPPEERSPKVTSELATKYPAKFSPIVVLFDEVQEYTEYGTKGNRAEMAIRNQFCSVLTRLSRLGRSAGVICVFVSQKPDANVLPTAIMGNCAVRVCFKVTEQGHNDQVLGTGAYKRGINATLFVQEDAGLAWLRAMGDPQVVRTWSAMVDLEPAFELAETAYQMRLSRGLLTGQAAGEEETMELTADLLDDVYEVLRENQCRNTSLDHLRDRLGLLRPGIYGHLTNETLGSLLREAGVPPDSIHCPAEGKTMRGVKVDWITDAIDARDGVDLTEDDENLITG